MNAPIFIVGANRSGTTLLRLILNAHSRIAIPDELNYFHSRLAGAPIKEWRKTELTTGSLNYFLRVLEDSDPGQSVDIARIRKDLEKKSPLTVRQPYELFLERWAALQGKERWGEKTPGNLFYADILIDMFPDAQFIHLVRDPRGGVSSMQRVSFFSDDVVFNALARHKSMTKGRAILENNVPEEQRVTIRYEDLVRDPKNVVQKICHFLNEEFEPEMLEYHKSADRYMKDEAANGFNAAATRPISPSVAEKWRDELAPVEVALIESICKSELNEFGYTLLNFSAPCYARLTAIIKQVYWHWQCWRHRHIRHYTVVYPMFAKTQSQLRRWRQPLKKIA